MTSIVFRAINWLDSRNETLTTLRVKPLKLKTSILPENSMNRIKFSSVGIVLQGPVVPELTRLICSRYRSLYPEITIVLSTWANQNPNELRAIQQLGVEVLENDLPFESGPSNVNLQIITTRAGIDYCLNKNLRYVLKNRSDGWLSSDNFLEYLLFLLSNFSKNELRIVVPSYNSFLFRLYSATDQFQFAGIEAMSLFWGCALADSETLDFRFPESYLLRRYLHKIGREVSFTIEDSLSVYRDYFVIADNECLGVVLNKGTKSDVSNRWANDGFPQTMSEIRFWQWLELQENTQSYIKLYEELRDSPAV